MEEWFYSYKQKEVLKALEYNHVNNVRFMLEKALKHKDPAVVAKAKEYLESLGKDKGEGDGTKKQEDNRLPGRSRNHGDLSIP